MSFSTVTLTSVCILILGRQWVILLPEITRVPQFSQQYLLSLFYFAVLAEYNLISGREISRNVPMGKSSEHFLFRQKRSPRQVGSGFKVISFHQLLMLNFNKCILHVDKYPEYDYATLHWIF